MSSAYITILSSNGIEFIVAKEIAGLSEIFKKQIANADMRGETQILSDFTADILEIVLQYLHYKNRWQLESPVNLPKFQIAKEKALSVLQAAIALQI
ncbi:unnamed protein product (macronuclear) [Paramecium tetraurelia]|uniref:Elongin-C n=1 Tax=Paramecium tetraurelia TaxID=5888 RepID=A0C581_PARTE|nr:uncharacterized protein GSPATT00006447001 [Paramecium tetraurelia]CAK65948.1 unnamed protein product [Paramecium tetraurelia]|eukprot:XP_001433345.1 hypothetical protein (macronuclear) [Paramecium tetraurelia strain d4-2]